LDDLNRIIPSEFKKFVDLNYDFRIVDAYPTIEIELDRKHVSIPKYYKSKSHRRTNGLQIQLPESIYLEVKLESERRLWLIISREKYPNIFNAGIHLCESLHTGPRFQKYLELYKSYESITTPNARDIEFSAVRHSISHASRQLTKQIVVEKLTEVFGGLSIDLSKYGHRKEFFIRYWNLLIAVDKLLFNAVSDLTTQGSEIVKGIRVIR